MRQLASALLAAQQQDSRVPFVRVEVSNKHAGVVNLRWERLYDGAEDDYHHGLTMPGDGSMVRVRVTPPADSRKLYRQRVADPGPQSDFSQWLYTGQYDVIAAACCSLGAEVSIFWINGDRELYHLKSTDYGASWASPQLLTTSSTVIVGRATAQAWSSARRTRVVRGLVRRQASSSARRNCR